MTPRRSVSISVKLAVALGFTVAGVFWALHPPAGTVAREAAFRPDLGPLAIDPDWARALAARPRDATGTSQSAVVAQTHGSAEATPKKKARYESRLFRTGFPGVEPTLGVTTNGWIFYVALDATGATMDSVPASIVIRSKDGGQSWQAVTASRPTNDPYLWVDPATDRVFWADYAAYCGLLSYSDDYGETWTDAPPVGCGYNSDHQTLYAGPPVTSSTSGYPNIVYYCSIGAGLGNQHSAATVCSKSLDGGRLFTPTLTPPYPVLVTDEALFGRAAPCNGASGHIFVGTDGVLYVPRGVCGQPWLAISRDEGNSWVRVQVADNSMGKDIFSNWDHEAAVRADGAGNVFYAWVARDRIPYLAVSGDGGATWGAPIRIAPPEVNEANLPNMDLDENGRLAFVYMGSTNSPGAPFPNDGGCEPEHQLEHTDFADCGINQAAAAYADTTWTGYITFTDNPTAAAPTFTSAALTTPEHPLIRGECGPFRCQAEYDFIDIDLGPNGEIVAALVDGSVSGGGTSFGEAVLGALVDPALAPPPPPARTFIADGSRTLAFTPLPERATGARSPEGCEVEAGAASGRLAPPGLPGACHTASQGFVAYKPDLPAEFTSEPLPEALVAGGSGRLVLHMADPVRPLAGGASEGLFEYRLEVVAPDGAATSISSGVILDGYDDGRNEAAFEVTPTEIPAGHRLRFRFVTAVATTSAARLLFGGSEYGDAGITLTTGHWDGQRGRDKSAPEAPESQGVVVGSFSWLALLVLAASLMARLAVAGGLPSSAPSRQTQP